MKQVELLQLSMNLKPGQAIQISNEDMREAASGELSSLLFDSVRDSDVEEFVAKISENWNVSLYEDKVNRRWTMAKAAEYARGDNMEEIDKITFAPFFVVN